MPNWCSNTITITGTPKQIELLTRILEDEPKSNPDKCIVFKSLIGTQPGISEEEYKNGAWYDSNVAYYGTKWDVDYASCNFEFEKEQIKMSPDTAWSPPVNFGLVLHNMYGVSVELFYSEGGCNFCGKTTIDENGVIEDDYGYAEGHYYFDNDHFWEGLIESEIESAIDEEKDVNDFVEEYGYLTPEEREELKEMYIYTLNQKQEQ